MRLSLEKQSQGLERWLSTEENVLLLFLRSVPSALSSELCRAFTHPAHPHINKILKKEKKTFTASGFL